MGKVIHLNTTKGSESKIAVQGNLLLTKNRALSILMSENGENKKVGEDMAKKKASAPTATEAPEDPKTVGAPEKQADDGPVKCLSVEALADLIRRANQENGRFCFILGSGASVESGIPDGKKLEMDWMNCLMGKNDDPDEPGGTEAYTPERVQEWANVLHLTYSFDDLKSAWEDAIANHETTLPSEYYFDIYRLRFFPDPPKGFRYLEQIMEKSEPSIGYHTLALLMTKNDSLNNLLITTNFDSLAEDAITSYTDKRPLVIAHESLAGYMDVETSRPIIAKVHRGLFYEPFNTTEETNKLDDKWKPALLQAFRHYAPIVIGYAGGDQSLMSFLEEPGTEMKHGFYWCIRGTKEPDERIKKLVKDKKGCFVRIDGFDQLMMKLGSELYGDETTPTETGKLLEKQAKQRFEKYNKQWDELDEKTKDDPSLADAMDPLKEEEQKKAQEREKNNTMTFWDYFRQGKEASHKGDYPRAVEAYTEAIKLWPESDAAYNNRGNALNNLRRYEEALQDFNRAIELNPKNDAAYNNRGYALNDLGHYEEALQDFNRAIELNPKNDAAYNNRGYALNDLGHYEEALQDFNRAIELNPKNDAAYNNRGYALNNLGRYEEALDDLDKAIGLGPDDEAPYRHRGNAKTALGRHEEALKDFNKAIELDPKYKEAYRDRAECYRKLGKTELAEADDAKADELKKE